MHNPTQAAVRGVHDYGFPAGSVASIAIRAKANRIQLHWSRPGPVHPGYAAICRLENRSIRPCSEASPGIRREIDGEETAGCAGRLPNPREATIRGLEDRAKIADRVTRVSARKGDGLKVIALWQWVGPEPPSARAHCGQYQQSEKHQPCNQG
jgi:hypothetical protein